MNTRLIVDGKTYFVSNYGDVAVRVVREPRVMRDGFVQWRSLKRNGATAVRVRAIAEFRKAKEQA